MEIRKIISRPTDSDLAIGGELLGIDVHFTSFEVKFQLVVDGHRHPTLLEVHSRVFPIETLQRFFYVNGREEHNFISTRPDAVMGESNRAWRQACEESSAQNQDNKPQYGERP